MCCPTWSVVTAFHIIKFSLRLNFLPTLSNFNYLACLGHTPEIQGNPGVAEPCEHLLVCCQGLSFCPSLLGTCICAAVVASVAQADAVIGSLGLKFLARTEWNRLSLLFSCSSPGEVWGGSFSVLHKCCGCAVSGLRPRPGGPWCPLCALFLCFCASCIHGISQLLGWDGGVSYSKEVITYT